MRKEASIEQWKTLYEAGTRIKELKPWEKFWDMDLIGIRYGAEEETIFFSILGRGGDCYGIAVYEGYEGLNSFLMLTMQESMNLAPEYAMFNQRSGYLQDLELALRYYEETDIQVDFESGNMFLLSFGKDKKTWNFGEEPLPFTTFQFGNLLITDEDLLSDLGKAPKRNVVLEADISVLGASVTDKKYDRPANPALSLLGDANTGTIIKFEMLEPEDDAIVMLAEILIGFIFQFGAPKEIRVSNIIVEAGLEQICNVCGIKLRRVKRLKGLEDFKYSMQRFRQ